MKSNLKIAIIRFSSIGDIVLTTPVIRCCKQQLTNVRIHFVTKKSFANILSANPYIDKIHSLNNSLSALIEELKAENFDYIIDLHNNIRTTQIKCLLGKKAYTFNKINIRKWLAVNIKLISVLPNTHIVHRYIKTVEPLKVVNDNLGLDYFIPENEEVLISNTFNLTNNCLFTAIVVGAKHTTKQIPIKKLVEICAGINKPIILLGGPEDYLKAQEVINLLPQNNLIFNSCGKFSLHQSASILKQAQVVITPDTGLMHIAAAFNKPIISVWGNTIPELGMSAYMPENTNLQTIMQVPGLSCRPCSKLGYQQCPKKHFNCMQLQNVNQIIKLANQY